MRYLIPHREDAVARLPVQKIARFFLLNFFLPWYQVTAWLVWPQCVSRTNGGYFKLILTLWTSSFYKETRYVYFLFYRNIADLLQYKDDEKIRSRVLVISDRWVEHLYSIVLIIHIILCQETMRWENTSPIHGPLPMIIFFNLILALRGYFRKDAWLVSCNDVMT